MQNVFSVDGKYYDVWIYSLTRKATVLDSDQSGRTIDGGMHRFIIGTYYNYSLEIGVKSASDYDELYELITSPVASHDLVIPYGQSVLSFKAYVTEAEDNLIAYKKPNNRWGGLTIEFTAMKPHRYPA